jgi:predicted ATP-binding protein involved in virulence
MQLKEIRIAKLFGHFNHKVPLNNKDKITIITAPNGYGKTMILKVLNAAFNRKMSFIKNLEFESIFFIFKDKYLSFKKNENEDLYISLYLGAPNEHDVSDATPVETCLVDEIIDLGDIPNAVLNKVDSYIPHLDRMEKNQWYDHQDDEVLNITEILDKYDSLASSLGLSTSGYPEWLDEILSSINVHIVQDQRLILRSEINNSPHHIRRKGNKRTIDTIEKYSVDLTNMMTSCNTSYSEISKRLDGSLPTRLLSKQNEIRILELNDLKVRLKGLREKNERLKKHNLLITDDQSIFNIGEISTQDIKILSLYVQDNNEKLGAYNDLLSRIELFTDILNNKGLAFKKIVVNPEKGFLFVNDSGKELKLTQLSSGEQHEVVLVYELIFIAKDNDLVLIDEPEISLHIAWQKEFLEDIKRIIDIQNVSIVIATHSPQIIDNNWDLTVDLEDE